MNQDQIQETMLGLGLSQDEQLQVERITPPDVRLVNFDQSTVPSRESLESFDPFLIWIAWRFWKDLSSPRRESLLKECQGAVVLLLDGPLDFAELGPNLDHRLTVLRPPLDTKAMIALLENALETRRLYQDIYHMTQEILLERELLQRKNDYLTFINRFLTRVTESLDTGDILRTARAELPKLLPVQSLHACFWETGKPHMEAHLALAKGLKAEGREAWIELLLQNATQLAEREPQNFQLMEIPGETIHETPVSPEDGHVLILPLRYGGGNFGCLALAAEEEYQLSHDQVELLNATTSHLALALKNALLFHTVKDLAEYDGLTRIHNRQHFEDRLPQELGRHNEAGATMSLLLIDLDHFKQINDAFGHQTGDMVLREIGKIIREHIRTTDYAARYGGEEFVVLLPECPQTQAWLLAERLRRAMSQKVYECEGEKFTVTASIGVATLGPEEKLDQLGLMNQADRSLYMAKKQGRNQVFCLNSPSLDRTADA